MPGPGIVFGNRIFFAADSAGGDREIWVISRRAPEPYSGPVITSAVPVVAAPGQTVSLSGSNLSSVSAIEIDGVKVTGLKVTSTGVSFVVPAVTSGLKDLQVQSSYGVLTVQGALRVTARLSNAAKFFTKRVGDQIKVVAVGSSKVRVELNGKRVASRQSMGSLNRSFELTSGKNVVEIFVDGERVLRRVASR
jgi:hypothetical protein